MKRIAVALGLGLVILGSCEKEELIDPIPEIQLLSIGPENVKEFEDSLVFRIFYKDGDGDLGGGHPDSSNVFVRDNRSGVLSKFRLQALVPNNERVPIQGEIDLRLNSLFIVDSSQNQSVNFSIHFVDRAGNRSNTLNTPSITIYK